MYAHYVIFRVQIPNSYLNAAYVPNLAMPFAYHAQLQQPNLTL